VVESRRKREKREREGAFPSKLASPNSSALLSTTSVSSPVEGLVRTARKTSPNPPVASFLPRVKSESLLGGVGGWGLGWGSVVGVGCDDDDDVEGKDEDGV